MKNNHLIGLVLLTSLFFACQDDEMLSTSINCESLEEGLIQLNAELVEGEINAICEVYPPAPTSNDPQGHEVNLDDIVSSLNEDCGSFTTTLGCYACLESYPPQSVINFTLDSSGVDVQRSIRLLTPSDDVMAFWA